MAIPTKYDGIEYRSRLEARWAAFMRNIGWDIVYEPFDGDGYIPDFLVQGDAPLLVEVKPAVTQKDYEAAVPKAEKGLAQHWQHDILIVGASNIRRMSGPVCISGWLGEYAPWFADDNGGGFYPREEWEQLRRGYANRTYTEMPEWEWGQADWTYCRQCRSYGVRATDRGWHQRPCGHDRDTYAFASPYRLKDAWADACNDVKWRGSAA